MDYNRKLKELYNSKIEDIKTMFNLLNGSTKEADTNFSWPLAIQIWEEEYEKAPVKLMVFGQETNGWNNPTNPSIETNDADSLTAEYLDHHLGRHRLGVSAFFRTMHELNRMLGNPDTDCFVWNNILKFGKEDGKGYPSDAVMDAELKYLNVVSKEVEILKPDVCVFFTGPNYDIDIKKRFPDVEFIPIEGFSERELVRIKSSGLPAHSYRTYHPEYGKWHSEEYNSILNTLVKLVKNYN